MKSKRQYSYKKILCSFLLFIVSFFAQASDSTKLEIYFQFNKFSLSSTATHQLDSFCKSIDTSKVLLQNIFIYGHTDQIGSNNYNDILSINRANSTAIYLESIGIDEKKISIIKGFGKRQLATTLMDEKDRFFNRRVIISFLFETKKIVIAEPEIKPIKPNISKANEPKPTTQKLADKIKDTTLKVGDNIELPYILFVGGMHEFLNISYPYLDELFFVMRDNPTLEIEIQGHVCCESGISDGIDLASGRRNLSYARARAVYDFLRKSGIEVFRMSYKGFGHQFPLTQERTDAEKTRNRRVEIKVVKK